jgi:hypothetical protein
MGIMLTIAMLVCGVCCGDLCAPCGSSPAYYSSPPPNYYPDSSPGLGRGWTEGKEWYPGEGWVTPEQHIANQLGRIAGALEKQQMNPWH